MSFSTTVANTIASLCFVLLIGCGQGSMDYAETPFQDTSITVCDTMAGPVELREDTRVSAPPNEPKIQEDISNHPVEKRETVVLEPVHRSDTDTVSNSYYVQSKKCEKINDTIVSIDQKLQKIEEKIKKIKKK